MSFKGRQQANIEILNYIGLLIVEYPDLRFGQILASLDVTQTTAGEAGTVKVRDIFYDESTDILARVAKARIRLDGSEYS
jgi:hypothetical protein